MRPILTPVCLAVALALGGTPAYAQSGKAAAPAGRQAVEAPPRDEFFWLGEINKATAVINAEQGLLDRAMAPRLAAAVAQVIRDGNQPGAKRPATVKIGRAHV